jgi:hypothetical protein
MNDDAGSANKHHAKSKFLSKDRWRGKKAPNESGEDYQLNADVVDFLKPSTNKLRSVSPRAPRIDIAAAQRWSGHNPELKSGNAVITPSSLRGKGDNERRARRKNLTVKFVSTAPEVIGEGGDEAESPAIEISRRRQTALMQAFAGSENNPSVRTGQGVQRSRGQQSGLDDTELHPGFGQETQGSVRLQFQQSPAKPTATSHFLPHEDMEFVPKQLVRTGTSWSDYSDEHHNPASDDEDSDAEPDGPSPGLAGLESLGSKLSYHLPEIKSVIENSPIEMASYRNIFFEARPRDRSSLSAQLQHLMAEGEGKALHNAAKNQSADATDAGNRLSSSTTSSYSYKAYSPVDTPSSAFSGPAVNRLIAHQAQPSTASSGSSSRNITPMMPSASPLANSNSTPLPTTQPRPAMPLRKPLPTQPSDSQEYAQVPQSFAPPPPTRPPPQQPLPARVEQPSSLPPLVIPKGRNGGIDQRAPPTAITTTTYAAISSASSGGYTQAAYEDFADRCSHMPGIFRLQAEYELPLNGFTPTQWQRCAAWWFLKGRAGMEAIIRSRPRSEDGRPMSREMQQFLVQPHVDLAKAWWILNDVFPNHPGFRASNDPTFALRAATAREAGDIGTADLMESAEVLQANLKAVVSSMSRNGVMPPSHALIQGQDQTIWVRYPKIAPNVVSIFSGNVSLGLTDNGASRQFNPLSVMAVADTKTDFSYSRVFANATLASQDTTAERMTLPCLVSTMRPRNDWNPKVTICSQKELVTVCISGDRKAGSSWEDVRWSEEKRLIHVRLSHGYTLDVQLPEPDFKQIWNAYNHSYKVQSSLLPQNGEKMVFEVALRDCQYKDSRQPPAFPPERIKRCRIRLFVRSETRVAGTGQRRFYRGQRLLVVTSPKNRVLGSASHDLGLQCPTFIEMGIDPSGDGAAAMKMIFNEEKRQRSLYMVFNEPKDQQALYRTLNDMDPGPDEMQYASIRLSSLAIEAATTLLAPHRDPSPLIGMKWQAVSVINGDPLSPDHEIGKTVLSDSLRVLAQAADGTLTDRINLGPGELQMRLNVDGGAELNLLRSGQDDLSLTVDTSRSHVLPDSLMELMRTIYMQQTVRTYSFVNLEDLHVFQKAITGYTVKYDGVASSFIIARRRPTGMLSLHKRLEAGPTRLQVVFNDQDKTTQLLAFFDDFPHADALGFQLKGVDVFEKAELKGEKSGGGRFGVRLVDAKFALPGTKGKETPDDQDISRKFVCLDMPEYPREDDDITIAFDDERGRKCILPRPIRKS